MTGNSYRRKLPHIRIDGAVYFVTWRVSPGQADLSSAERDCAAGAIRHFDRARYDLHAYVIMNDHVHVLVQLYPEYQLEDIVRSWKSFIANRLQREHGRQGVLWQAEYFDRVVRDDAEYDQKRGYILNNARKRWPELDAYPWHWAIGLEREL